MQGFDVAHPRRDRRRRAGALLAPLIAALTLAGAALAASTPDRHAHHKGERQARQQRPDPAITVRPSKGGRRLVQPGLFGVNHRYAFDGYGMWDPSIPGVPRRFEHSFDAARIKAMRFPGGAIANTYHWERAIGPVAQRRRNVGGRTGEPLTNDFGPDEFGQFVLDHGLEAMMVANFGTGTAREAADWVEYMNAPVGANPSGGVAWAERRAANGHPQPYDVRNWEIGNELYGKAQSYWMGKGSLRERSRKYAFGGSTKFPGQRVGTPSDHRDSAAVSDGSPDQHFQVLYPPVDAAEPFALKVGHATWDRVADLSRARAGAHTYELDPATGKIAFGDGAHGAIPPSGAVVRASYTSGPHDGFVDFYREMKAADPSIQVGSSFRNGRFLSLMGNDHPYDFVVAHIYSHRPPRGYRGVSDFHDGIMRLAGRRASKVAAVRRAIRAHAGARGDHIPVIVSEYGMSFRRRPGRRTGNLRRWPGPTPNYMRSMDQALYTSLELQRWMKMGVPLAGKQSLIDFHPGSAPRGASALGLGQQAVIGPAPRYVPSATARAFRLLAPASGQQLIPVKTQGNPSRRIYTGGTLHLLSATATRGTNGSVYLVVVNKDRTRTIHATVAVKGPPMESAVIHRLVAPSFLSSNSMGHSRRVSIHNSRKVLRSRRMSLRLDPHSLTTVELLPGASTG
jgi:alpha-N-arabinofuranosidase